MGALKLKKKEFKYKEKKRVYGYLRVLKFTLYNVLENETSLYKQLYDVGALFLVITSSIAILFDLIPHWNEKLPPDLDAYLTTYEDVVLWFFVIEYILRLWVISNFTSDFKKGFYKYPLKSLPYRILIGLIEGLKPKVKWMFTPYALIDLLAILPVFRPFRAFRILRLLRILKIVRYGGAIKSLILAFREQSLLFMFILFALATWIIGISLIVYVIEYNAGNKTFTDMWNAIYWGIVTVSTVGYGDITPITKEGKFLTAVMIGGGMILVASLTGTFSAALVSRLMSIKGGDLKLETLENHIVICGWNETAEEIVEQMISMGIDKERGIVIITNVPKEQIGIKLPDYIGYKKGDFVHDNVLLDVAVDKASDVIIVAEREDGLSERNIDARTALAAMIISNINPTANIYVEVLLDEDAEIFQKRMKVREVLIHGQMIGKILFSSILNPGATDLIKELIDKESGIKKVRMSNVGNFETFGELLISAREKNFLPIAIERDEKVLLNPEDSFKLKPTDYVFLIPTGSTK